MKQYKLINAFKATEQMADDKSLSVQSKWNLYQLRKKLSVHADFQDENERNLRNKYMPFANEQGVLEGEKYIEYINELDELSNMDIDIGEIQKTELSITPDITVHTMEALEDFVEFKQ